MTYLEKIIYTVIIFFCLYKLINGDKTIKNFDSEIIHPSFIGYHINHS